MRESVKTRIMWWRRVRRIKRVESQHHRRQDEDGMVHDSGNGLSANLRGVPPLRLPTGARLQHLLNLFRRRTWSLISGWHGRGTYQFHCSSMVDSSGLEMNSSFASEVSSMQVQQAKNSVFCQGESLSLTRKNELTQLRILFKENKMELERDKIG